MTIIKTSIMLLGLVVAFLPTGEDVKAYSTYKMESYTAYPLPLEKPKNTCKSERKNEYLDQKQAAAAALGLYLGVKIALAPQGYKTENAAPHGCVG